MASKTLNFGAAIRKDMFSRADGHDMVLAAVSKDGMQLRNVKHQTTDVCIAAIRQNWRALQFVQDIQRCVALEQCIVTQAIWSSPQAASLLPPVHHLYAVCVNIQSFNYIAKPTMECCRYVISKMPDWISKRPNPPLELCIVAVEARFKEAVFKARVNHGYYPAINYLRLNYLQGMQVSSAVLAELQKAAIPATKGWALLSYPEDIQALHVEAAVRITPALYEHVPHLHTDALNRIVCLKDPRLLAKISNPSRDLVWEMATYWHKAVYYAENQDDELCVHAVRKAPAAIAYVRKERMRIWMKAGYKQLPPLTTLFPEFITLMQRSLAAAAFFKRIQTAMSRKPAARTTVASTTKDELVDPITMEPVPAGTVCAFLADSKGGEHFAGTLDSLLYILSTGFRGSTVGNLFIPIKNDLVSTEQIKWRLI